MGTISAETNGTDSIESAIDYVLGGDPPPGVADPIGTLLLPRGPEEQRCKNIIGILRDYGQRPNVDVPISIAVFGPPGSGKSFTVEQILASMKDLYAELIPVNLSQLSDPKELTVYFRKLAESTKRAPDPGPEAADTSVPSVPAKATPAGASVANGTGSPPGSGGSVQKVKAVFFDEFDSVCDGAALGWLRWFLSPMQDSKFFDPEAKTEAERIIKFNKAVFFFAGGTASSLEEFKERASLEPALYRDAKVPDFISRLRGFIDIRGINEDDSHRVLRRAIVLKNQLDKRWRNERNNKTFQMDRDLVRSLLSNVHYVHGVRSIGALLDMSHIDLGQVFARDHLPEPDLKKLHLSRGPLDGMTVGISAGQDDYWAADLLKELAVSLLRSGATLAYGGDLVEKGTLQMLVQASQEVPTDLLPPDSSRIRNYLGFPSYLNKKRPPPADDEHIKVLKLETLSREECDLLRVPRKDWFEARPQNKRKSYDWRKHMAWAISLFRMRLRLIQDITALIVIGGKTGQSWGRFSGIAEEVILAMALRKPVYVLGKCGGASHHIGLLLGLGETIVNPIECLDEESEIAPHSVREQFARAFCVPRHPEVPENVEGIRRFLSDRFVATGNDNWPWNGLQPQENRALFDASIDTEGHRKSTVDLLLRGLSRLNWKPQTKQVM